MITAGPFFRCLDQLAERSLEPDDYQSVPYADMTDELRQQETDLRADELREELIRIARVQL